jgi:hypothetical protein
MEPVEILHRLINPEESASSGEYHNVAAVEPFTPAKLHESGEDIHSLIAHPGLQEYALTERDVLIISLMWQRHLEQIGMGLDWAEICSCAQLNKYRVTECLEYITGLLERQIICFDEKIAGDYYLNPLILQSAQYNLSSGFILKTMGRDLQQEMDFMLSEQWTDNVDFLRDLKLVFDLCFESFGTNGSRGTLDYSIQTMCLNILKKRIIMAPMGLEIKSVFTEYCFSEYQEDLLLIVLDHQLHRKDFISIEDLILSLAPDPRYRWILRKQFEDNSRLITEEVICKQQGYRYPNKYSLSISDRILNKMGVITGEENLPGQESLASFFEKCEVRHRFQDLIISEEQKSLLATIVVKCQQGHRSDLDQWGFHPEKSQTKPGTVILLYGAPGTGKTFAAGAIANEMGRELIMLNVSQLRDKFYGVTEKQVKQAFVTMRKMALKSDSSYLFLINEADQLIHNRIQYSDTFDMTENTIQSIILEELETFPGILILTTNLETNIDEAYFRRFDLKLEFRLPNKDCRRNLWNLYLKNEIPGAKKIDREYLCQKYEFSGAQIALVIKNACLEAVNREGKEKLLTLADLSKYADLEQTWTRGFGKSIGF